MALQLWETLKEAIPAYTGLSPATFFTAVAVAIAVYYAVSGLYESPPPPRARESMEEMEPLPPPVQLGEISDEKLKVYNGSDPKKPLLMAIEGQIYDVSQSSVSENLKMEDSDPSVKRWEDMQIDPLVKIFQQLTLTDLDSISRVCSTWRLACKDPILWKTLDLGQWESNYIKLPNAPYVCVASKSTQELTRALKIALGLSCDSINIMIFHYNLYMNDKHLLYVAKKSPHLKRLVLPGWDLITEDAMIKAINMWKELVSLTMPSVCSPNYVMQQIGRNCKNFSELKVMGLCDTKFVEAISEFIPNLKVLSLRCSKLYLKDLLMILDKLQHLQVLNISHCVLVETYPAPQQPRLIRELDMAVMEKAARLQSFMYCMEETCITCQRAVKDISEIGVMRWYNYEDGFWARDEVSSLAH